MVEGVFVVVIFDDLVSRWITNLASKTSSECEKEVLKTIANGQRGHETKS